MIDVATSASAGLFKVSSPEALALDPQPRLLLEMLEQAGIDLPSLRGADAGVFAGLTSGDPRALLERAAKDVEACRLTGTSGSAASGRVAYVLGLDGRPRGVGRHGDLVVVSRVVSGVSVVAGG